VDFEIACPEIAKELPGKDHAKVTTISFDETVKIYPTLHIQDYTRDEVGRAWYSRFDLKAMKRQCREVLSEMEVRQDKDASSRTILGSVIELECRDDIEAMESAKENNPHGSPKAKSHDIFTESNQCFRGLEGKTTGGQIKKRMIKENAREVVFREQRRQLYQGDTCPETIAQEYKKATALARTSAYRLARKDEKDALDLLLLDHFRRDHKLFNSSGDHTRLRLRKALNTAMVPRHHITAPFSPRLAALLEN
jgi:hypothetical protein